MPVGSPYCRTLYRTALAARDLRCNGHTNPHQNQQPGSTGAARYHSCTYERTANNLYNRSRNGQEVRSTWIGSGTGEYNRKPWSCTSGTAQHGPPDDQYSTNALTWPTNSRSSGARHSTPNSFPQRPHRLTQHKRF